MKKLSNSLHEQFHSRVSDLCHSVLNVDTAMLNAY